VDAAVADKPGKGHPGDLAAHGVEGGEGYGIGGVVDDDVHAGEVLQGADVAALAADDAPLHVVAGQGHHRDGGLGDDVGGQSLDGRGQDVACPLIALLLKFGFELTHAPVGLFAHLLLDLSQENPSCFLGGQVGQALDLLTALSL